MTIRTITFDDEQWQVGPQELTGSMIDTINGHIDADSDAVALWRDALIDAPEPPAQPRRPYGTDTMSEYGVIPECDGSEPPAQQPTDEHTDMLRELLASYGNSGFSAERAALTAAIEALEPPAQQPTEIEEAISAGDGTLHGAIDHWQSRALAAEAMLRDCAEALRGVLEILPICPKNTGLVGIEAKYEAAVVAARAALAAGDDA